ncbi:hypothetical protein AERO9A_410097 [Aeromonas salmonicida]|nr:hypothetical protein AERO9A_410097 [Aeromonas salmonicida]
MSYSRMANATLPSALPRFTSEFGMGSGGSTALWPPGKLLQSEKADVNNELPVGFAITELVSSSFIRYKARNTSWVLYG